MHRFKTQSGFILLETIVSLGLLVGGILSFESLELLMRRGEQRMVHQVQRARYDYEVQQMAVTNEKS
ncbi:histidine kinase [Lactiplantibacillus plajomi]|uniref:Histidine kinase n=1 Tax=Lactiplantibacillus plajomi TaxID=1457217 RepID=A0ABV6K9U3_9LACO|nr:histidine kinase [Lactiplantibacillus plajomi]